MKNHLLIGLLCLMVSSGLFAQGEPAAAPAVLDTNWRFGGFAQLNLNQVALVNWAAGGNNSFSASIIGNAFANYKHHKWSSDNYFDGSWGLIRSKKRVRKNEDRLEINSANNYEFHKHWQATALLNFKSQFTYGFDYDDETNINKLVSKFAAPAYLAVGLGITYRPNDWFHVYLSPMTGKFNIVRRDARIDETRYGLDAGDNFRGEYGAYLTSILKYEIFKNVNLWTKLDLFNNYTDPNKPNRKNIDVDWQVRLDFKVNKYISASIQTQMIYDHNIDVPIDTNDDGQADSFGKRLQFREALGIAFSYKFNAVRTRK